MRENTLRNAPLDGLSITLTWSIPENPPSQGPEYFFSNYQLRFKDSQPDSSIICIVKNDGWSTGDTHTATSCRTNGKASASTWTSTGSAST